MEVLFSGNIWEKDSVTFDEVFANVDEELSLSQQQSTTPT